MSNSQGMKMSPPPRKGLLVLWPHESPRISFKRDQVRKWQLPISTGASENQVRSWNTSRNHLSVANINRAPSVPAYESPPLPQLLVSFALGDCQAWLSLVRNSSLVSCIDWWMSLGISKLTCLKHTLTLDSLCCS